MMKQQLEEIYDDASLDCQHLIEIFLGEDDVQTSSVSTLGDCMVPFHQNDEGPCCKKLRKVREHDPFFYFSLPGALKHDTTDREDVAADIVNSVASKPISRKTRVSCEVYSDYILLECLADFHQEIESIAKETIIENKTTRSDTMEDQKVDVARPFRGSSGSQRKGYVANAA
mmetsp:Transcript_25141/g.52985  ORF Transcript_25141/g.52985 Transcript_25141/m.52985 type:complete len:172 (+) Transcript_25141:109-624(+)|eukprot:CAMPEP_0171411330 /NCGR_PEP_ID=MMETSP0880-20121228/29833_1 /TAXON_ID=67004 /ORGANISM="Thalassiosira weissflogii, Strain CCMP1336" /LENGTH=171 /DNA_ID=CAMNT_0011928393 /DNA_START=38 /DNA_END=553 /DNA_ORIENTATION=+